MDPTYIVYRDGIIAVGLFAENASEDKRNILHVGLRWLPPETYRRQDGQAQQTTNVMGGETQWFLLPHSFGAAVGRKLIEQRVVDRGLAQFFTEPGFERMVSWLVEGDELSDGMCY